MADLAVDGSGKEVGTPAEREEVVSTTGGVDPEMELSSAALAAGTDTVNNVMHETVTTPATSPAAHCGVKEVVARSIIVPPSPFSAAPVESSGPVLAARAPFLSFR
jgi:hypothetical protein